MGFDQDKADLVATLDLAMAQALALEPDDATDGGGGTPPAATFNSTPISENECTVNWVGVVPVKLGRDGVDTEGHGPWDTGPLTDQPASGSFTFGHLIPGLAYNYTLTDAAGATLQTHSQQPVVGSGGGTPPPSSGVTFLDLCGSYNGRPDTDEQPGWGLGPEPGVGLLDGETTRYNVHYPWGWDNLGATADQTDLGTNAAIAASLGMVLIPGFPLHGGIDHATFSYADVKAGKRDKDADLYAQILLENDQPNAEIRIGWEGNQARAKDDPKGSVEAANRLIDRIKAVGPDLKCWWNPCMDSGNRSADLEKQFPDHVDGVALNIYCRMYYKSAGGPLETGAPNPGAEATWEYTLDPPVGGQFGIGIGLEWMLDFARRHGLKTGLHEYGLGYTDDWGVATDPVDCPSWATNVARLAMANADIWTIVGIWNAHNSTLAANPNWHAAINDALTLTPT